MFKQKVVCLLLCLTLVSAIFFQDIVRAADEVRNIVCTVAVVFVGVVLVASGVGAAVAAGSLAAPAWTTATVAVPIVGTLTAGSTTVLGASFLGGAVLMNGEGGGGGSGELDPRSLRIELVTFDRSADYYGPVSVSIRIRMIGTDSMLLDLPEELTLYASHSNPNLSLVEGCDPPSAASVGTTGEFVNINACPQVSVAGAVSEIGYTLDSQCRSVTMDVLDSSGSNIYSLTESSPNPARPIPFVWNGRDMSGKKVAAGTYSVRLNAIRNDGTAASSPIQVMSFGDTIDVGVEHEITSFSGGTATVRVWPPLDGSSASDNVTVTLKYGDEVLSSASQTVNFGEGSEGPPESPTITQNPLNFSSRLTSQVNGVPAVVEIPGADDASKIIRVTIAGGTGTNGIIYEYNTDTDIATIKGNSGQRSYSAFGEGRDVYYGIKKMMGSITQRIYEQVGITYDIHSKCLSVDTVAFLRASGLGSGYSVDVENSSGTMLITVSKGSNALSVVYALATNVVSTPSNLHWADRYDWDISSGSPIVAASPVSAAGVTASDAVDDTFEIVGKKLLATIVTSIRVYNIRDFLITEILTDSRKSPMDYPTEPDITNIIWLDRVGKRVRVSGTAGSLDSPIIYVEKGGVRLGVGSASGFGGSWSKDITLADGENKINAIVRRSGGREVESGDATVYVCTGSEPDFILVSPRDRQVFESESINQNGSVQIRDVEIKGSVTPGFSMTFDGNPMSINLDGTFRVPQDIYLREGGNIKSIIVNGSSNLVLQKNIIGAYKFVNHNKDNGYVIRRGDFLFSDKRSYDGLGVDLPFELIPLDPDHVGIYVGNGQVLDAIPPRARKANLSSTDPNLNYYHETLYYVTQPPKLFDESIRAAVADKALHMDGTSYDNPFLNSGSIYGHFDPGANSFYCSSAAYLAWERVVGGGDLGIDLKSTMYPFRGQNDPFNSILPAYFCEKTMKVKEVSK